MAAFVVLYYGIIPSACKTVKIHPHAVQISICHKLWKQRESFQYWHSFWIFRKTQNKHTERGFSGLVIGGFFHFFKYQHWRTGCKTLITLKGQHLVDELFCFEVTTQSWETPSNSDRLLVKLEELWLLEFFGDCSFWWIFLLWVFGSLVLLGVLYIF